MQNIDYSRKVRSSGPQPGWSRVETGPGGAGASGVPEQMGVRAKNRFFSVVAGVGMLMFTLGVIGGFQLNRLKHIEQNLVRYPDENRKEMVQQSRQITKESRFANTDPGAMDRSAVGRYIIHLGVFDQDQAEKLTSSLNNIPELAGRKPDLCKDFNETVPNRYLSFRSSAGKKTRQNVYVGCFSEAEEASRYLDIVKRSNLSGTAASRLYHID